MNLNCHLVEDFGKSKVYAVHTSRCFYRVVVGPLEVHLFGPGVEEIFTNTIPDHLSPEGKALVAVVIWEEGD